MSSENELTWAENPDKKRNQLTDTLASLVDKTKGFEEVYRRQHAQSETQQVDSAQLIDENSKKGYDNLKAAVKGLTQLDGEDKISRAQGLDQGEPNQSKFDLKKGVASALQDSVVAFEVVAYLSGTHVDTLGKLISDHTSMGDLAEAFMRELELYSGSLNTFAKEVFDVYDTNLRLLGETKNEVESTVEQIRAAEEQNESVTLVFASQVSSEQIDSLKQRLERKLARSNEYYRKHVSLYMLYIRVRNVSAATAALRERVKLVSDKFDIDQGQVTEKLNVESRLYEGLLKLRNHMQNPDLTYKRDKALRVILQLLKQDDEVFQRKTYYETTEDEIKTIIRDNLGSGYVESVMEMPNEDNFLDEF